MFTESGTVVVADFSFYPIFLPFYFSVNSSSDNSNSEIVGVGSKHLLGAESSYGNSLAAALALSLVLHLRGSRGSGF